MEIAKKFQIFKKYLRFFKAHTTPTKMLSLILLSAGLGAVFGTIFPQYMLAIRWIDILFVNLLRLVVLPLMFFSIVSAVISMSNIKRLKSVWIYTLVYILFSLSVAVGVGILLSDFFQPGVGMSSKHILLNDTPLEQGLVQLSAFLHSYLPFDVFIESKFELVPIVLLSSIVFGIACIQVGDSGKAVISLVLGMRDVFYKIIIWLMYLTPIGLSALLGCAIAEAYSKNILIRNIGGISLFITVFLLGLLFQFLWQIAAIKFIARKCPKEFMKYSISALTTAFATASSMTTLPVTLLAARDQKIRVEISDFVLPFAATINLTSTAMYEAVSALFFCQILDMHLSLFSQIGIFFTAIMAGMGSVGIPEGGIIAMPMVLRSASIPTSAIGILLPVDRILDRLRTMVNVWGDLVCAAMVDHFTNHSE